MVELIGQSRAEREQDKILKSTLYIQPSIVILLADLLEAWLNLQAKRILLQKYYLSFVTR